MYPVKTVPKYPDFPVINDSDWEMLFSSVPQGHSLRHTLPNVAHYTKCNNCGDLGSIMFKVVQLVGASDRKGVVFNGDASYIEISSYAIPCPLCRLDGGQDIITKLISNSGIELEEQSFTLDYFDDKLDGKEIAINYFKKLVNELPNVSGFDFISGGYGVGKSGMAKALVVAACKKLVPAMYISSSQIATNIRSTFKKDDSSESEKMLIAQYGRYRILVIDEVDIIGTSWEQSIIRQIIEKRYNQKRSKLTICISNDSRENLWPYLADRLQSGKSISVHGMNLRKL